MINKRWWCFFAGRLSFHAKAHPLAMYQALQAAKEALPKGQKLLLLELGWFGNAPIERAFEDAARWAAPDVDVRHLDGRQEENRQRAWAAANVFCSLSDNLQETFGITPIEAMATGLPTVVSDWDGYRGTVEHGVTGFRVPSAMPEAGQALGLNLAKRHALGIDTYDMYCGLTSSMVSIDIAATTQAFKQLFASETLRRSMGEAGRQRALQLYEWSVVMKQYEALWKGLSEIRQAAQPAALKPLGNWPARQDPFHIFAGYPSLPFNMNTGLRRRHASLQESLQFYTEAMALAMVSFARPAMPNDTELQTLIKAADQEQSVQDLLAHLPEERQALGLRGLAWLLKLGVFERAGSKPLG